MKNLFFVLFLSNILTPLIAQNPYEYIGEMHNSGLDFIFSKLQNHKKPTAEDIQNYTIDFVYNEAKKTHLENIDEQKLRRAVQNHLEILNTTMSKHKSFEEWFKNLEINSKAKNYLDEIFLLTGNIDGILKSLKSIENKVLIDDFGDKDICLIAISIMRNSSRYWSAKSTNSTNRINWEGIVKADIVGGVCGGIRGVQAAPIGGLVMGPGGAVLTVAGSAVAGGALSSAVYGAGFSWWW